MTNPDEQFAELISGYTYVVLQPHIMLAKTKLVEGEASTYNVWSGRPPYVVTTTNGSLVSAPSNGTFTAGTSDATLTVTDAQGLTATANATVHSPLRLAVNAGSWVYRNGHAMVTMNSKIYAFGGQLAQNTSSELLMFDPAWSGGGAWFRLSPAGGPPPTHSTGGAVIGGKMYIFAGTDANGQHRSDLWAYDPGAGTQGSWRETAFDHGPGVPPAYAKVAAFGTKLYAFGGIKNNAASNEIWSYDTAAPEPSAWTHLTPVGTAPGARFGHVFETVGDRIVMVSGYGNGYQTETWQFDPTDGSQGRWTQLSPAGLTPYARVNAGHAVLGAKLYVFGGSGLDDLWVLDTQAGAQGTWRALSPAGPIPAYRSAQITAAAGDRLYLVDAIIVANQYVSKRYFYDPAAGVDGTWTQETRDAILASRLVIGAEESTGYDVSGGYAPYSVTATGGTASNAAASGTYTAPPTTGARTLAVTDDAGHAASAALEVGAPLSIVTAGPTLASGGRLAFTGSGGSPPYRVTTSCYTGEVRHADGAGLLFSCQTGTKTLDIFDVLGTHVTTSVNVIPFYLFNYVSSAPYFYSCALNETVGFGYAGTPEAPVALLSKYGSITDNGDGTATYTALANSGTETITATDANGVVADYSFPLNAGVEIIGPTSVPSGSSASFAVRGGSGDYTIAFVDSNAGQSNTSGPAGNFPMQFGNSMNSGTVAITATDSYGLFASTNVAYGPLVQIQFAQPAIDANQSVSVSISYGFGTLTPAVLTGGSYSNGTFAPANGFTGEACIGVTDSGIDPPNNYSSACVTVLSPLQAAFDVTNVANESTANYVVSGGSGNYQVAASFGPVSNSNGSGIYSASSGTTGTVGLTVTDVVTGWIVHAYLEVDP